MTTKTSGKPTSPKFPNITKIPDPFLQWKGTIYWLDLQVRATDSSGQVVELGWKTTLNNPDLEYYDNAVFHLPDETDYYELYDPLTERRLDLAFVITGEPFEFELDFGDAPDRPYPTYLGNNGARHIVVPGFCLGAPVRVSQESAPGAGDFDNNVLGYVDPYVTPLTTAGYYQYGTPNGASFNGPEPPLISDRSHLFLVRASDGLSLFVVHDIPGDASGGTSKMHWEIFGDTVAELQNDDPGEGLTISGGGTVIDSRHGWSTCCTDGFAVGSLDGFWTAIGDFNTPTASTSMNEWHVYSSDNSSIPLAFVMNRRVRLDYHTSLDPDPDGQPNPTATGDDIMDGNDDEDGVIFTSPLIPGNPATVDVIASADGMLDAWIDWDDNGSWAGNQIFSSVPLAAGRNSLTFLVSPTAIPHTKRFARFRFSSAGGLSYIGMAMDGEVEDYLVEIEPKPPVDHLKWSQPPIRINPSAPSTQSYKLYATTFQAIDQLLSINPTTGAGSLIGNMSTLSPFGLSDRGTELYTFDKASDGNSIVRLDPTTGNTMYRIDINPQNITGEGALAFRSDGTGFLASCSNDYGNLWSFDITVPISTHIGGFQPSMDGLDFSPGGVLYGLEQGTLSPTYKLYTIDQTTATPTLVGDTGVSTNGGVAGLTFAPDGTLFAAMNDELYTLNPLTGAATLVGPIGFSGISGLTVLATATTEPVLPVFCGWDEPSYFPLPAGAPPLKVVADDYRCIGSMPVTSVHWWGSYLGWDTPYLPQPQPESWLITFWSNAVPPECVVVPNANTTVEGDTRNAWPFNLAWAFDTSSSMRYQQIYDAAEVGQSGKITEIRFRPDDAFGDPFGPNDMDCEIFLGYSANPVSSPSEWFANNIGPGYVKVFDGTLTLSSAASGGPPRNFDIVVDVDDVFTYNPAMGPLLLDIKMLTKSDTTMIDAAGSTVSQNATTRIFSSHTGSVNDPCGIVNYFGPDDPAYGLVTMICFEGTVPAMAAAGKETASSAIDRESVTIGPRGDVLGLTETTPVEQSSSPEDATDGISYPETPLWRVRVPADRVKVEYVGQDEFPLNPDVWPEACFQYYLDLQPDELFWQRDYLDKTLGDIFWVSIVAIYDSATQVGNPWGWKTRPWSWMDDAVTFNLSAEIPIGDKLSPDIVRPLEFQGESYDVAFELDTDPNYIKWEQPFTGLIHWPHYEDVLSTGVVVPPQTLTKYMQPPDLPEGIDVDATDDGLAATTQILADDFPCTTTGPITDIHIWASWFGDVLPGDNPRNVEITLSIHEDIPAVPGDPDSYSQPGPVRWWRTFRPGEFGVEQLQAYRQGYFIPCTGQYEPDNHFMAFRYDFYINPDEAFIQQGSPKDPVIYWLDVQAKPLSTTQNVRFGWKTTFFDPDIDRMDVAVFGVGNEPFDGPWKPMYHPETQRRLDMAFEITTTTEPELQIQSLVADDWKCKEETPVTAAVWWGSYIGYTYKACEDVPIVKPQKPDYFLLNVWTDVAAGDDPAVPYSHPGDKIWEYRADNFDEVLVGYDKHPHGTAASVADASCASCGIETDPAEVAQIRADAMSAAVVETVGLQMTNMGTEEPVIFNGHDLSTSESAAASGSCGSILYAPSQQDDPNFRTALSLACGGATVDYFDTRSGTPTVSLLSTYDCVMTWANYGYSDMNGFGNNLADYVDAGGKVILGQWCLPTASNYLGGRIMTSAYCPVTATSYGSGSYNGDGTDCVHNGVTAYSTSYLDICTLLAGNFSDGTLTLALGGTTLSVAWRPDRRVYYSAGNVGSSWSTGDWAQLTCNMCCCGAAREPVFRYSVRLPEDNWFIQEDVNNIYWFSVVAVYDDPATTNHYPWGWTNHAHAFNDDAVSGRFDLPGGWFWTELFDQTGESEDMSFMLFTEPDCLNRHAVGYNDWLAWGSPDCWCYQKQCRGDINGKLFLGKPVTLADLNTFKLAFNQPDPNVMAITDGICADLNHRPFLGKRVTLADLTIFKTYFNVIDALVPKCDLVPIYSGPYNYWTKP
ncbi:MAG: DUF7901 domain-containing protein [Planctomycetota bacterium]|jgi:hypothetical protein